MQRHGAIATVDGREGLIIIAGLGIGLSVPNIFVTRRYVQIRVMCGIYGQMQRYGAIATVDGREGLIIIAGLGVGLSVPNIFVTR